jgi:hypothetical protein
MSRQDGRAGRKERQTILDWITRVLGYKIYFFESLVAVSRHRRLWAGENQPPLTYRSGLFTLHSGGFPLLLQRANDAESRSTKFKPK